MSTEQELEIIEISIEQARQTVDTLNSLKRLTTNKDFISIIHEGYFEKEASRLVLVKAEPSMQTAEHQTMLLKQIDAVGYLRQYLSTIMQLGYTAMRSLDDDEKTREELLAEQVN